MAITDAVDLSKLWAQPLNNFAPPESNITVSMLRLDAIHPEISGNKWFKLKYNITAAKDNNCHGVLTFGGPYSNHLIATAAYAHAQQLSSIGILRGLGADTSVLAQCRAYGMALLPISREEYALKENIEWLGNLQAKHPNYLIIPEGGANDAGRLGAGDIAKYIPADYNYVLLSIGTGTSFAGIRLRLPKAQKMIGFAPMKGGIYLKEVLRNWLPTNTEDNWQLTDRFHFGGFGKMTNELADFMQDFEQQYEFPLDRVYTAKMMLGLKQLLQEGYFAKGAQLLCIHTGGLTGN